MGCVMIASAAAVLYLAAMYLVGLFLSNIGVSEEEEEWPTAPPT